MYEYKIIMLAYFLSNFCISEGTENIPSSQKTFDSTFVQKNPILNLNFQLPNQNNQTNTIKSHTHQNPIEPYSIFVWNENHAEIATGGRKIGHWNSTNISTDTRNLKKGDLFVALQGKNLDGHDFLDEAFSNGAIAAIISQNSSNLFPSIMVQDTIKALHDLASYYRKKILIRTQVIAITGSVGKTTTKDMLHSALSRFGICHSTKDNFNNHIGLPLTVLAAPSNCQYLILEMGMSQSGEIRKLSNISNPDIAIITNVEHVHSANFASLFDIARAKLEVVQGMRINGTLILNKDHQFYDYLSSKNKSLENEDQKIKYNLMSFGRHQNATIRLLNFTNNHTGLILKVKSNDGKIINYYLPVQGEHLVYSALASITVMKILKLEIPHDAFATFEIPRGRGNIYRTRYNERHIWLIDDSYNACPASMEAAIRVLGKHSDRRKVALLGDMWELGDEWVDFHRKLIKIITECKINRIYTVGNLMLELQKMLPDEIRGLHFDYSLQLANNLSDIIRNNDVILVKGSRGMKMDLIVQKILSR